MALRSSLALVLLAGCSGAGDRDDRAAVSTRLVERAGHGLGPPSPPGETVLPPGVAPGDGVSEEEGVAIALWNNAAFLEALSELDLRRADLVEAGLLPNPVLSVLFPLGPKQLEFAAKLPLEAIWLLPRRVAAAGLECDRAAELLVLGGLDLVRDVRLAFAELTLARRRATLGGETAAGRERVAALFAARLRAGDASELDLAASRVEALKARQEAARQSREVALAETRLRDLLGAGEDGRAWRLEDAAASAPALPDEAALVKEALAFRPDVRAAEIAVQAAAERLGLARAEIFAVTGILDANDRKGKEGLEIGPGLELPIPIFNQNDGARARAAAELDRAARRYLASRRAVAREVSEARTRLLQAGEGLEAWRAGIVPAAEDALRRAAKAHEKGEASPLVVLEAEGRLLEARTREAEAAAEAARARAHAERGVGGRLGARKEREP